MNLHQSSASDSEGESTLDPIHSSSDPASNCEDDDPGPIQDKIRDVLENFKLCYYGLIQFWAPLKMGGRWILTTSDQPFLIEGDDDQVIEKYRSWCVKYKYYIDEGDKVEDEEDPTNTIIRSGAPVIAFLNRMPEYLLHNTDDLMDSSAFKCGFRHSLVFPVFDPSQSCCAGVLQCSIHCYDLLFLVNYLNDKLEKVGLKTFHARDRLPYKTICGLQNAQDEVNEALKIVWDTHHLPSAQVWIPCEDQNQVAFSSSMQDTRTKRMLWLKLTGQSCDSCNDEDSFVGYGTVSYRIPLKMDKDFTGKTLENYEPHFIRNILKLNDNKPQRLSVIDFSCSCFVICLRSTKTRDLDYVFEFLWDGDRGHNVIFFIESLLLTLERCLPSFKIASGAEVGDELRILDVQDSTESEIKYFKIFQKKQLSPVSVTPKTGRRSEVEECFMLLKEKCKTTPIPSSHASQAQKRGRQSKVENCFTHSNPKDKTKERKFSREEIESEFGKTQREAAEKLNVSLSTLKRKCKEHGICEWPGPKYMKGNVKHSHNEEEDNGGAIQDPSANIRETSLGENILTIKVEYADHGTIKFHLPITSATFEDIDKKITEGFKLSPSDYKINYLDEDGDWILLSSDEDMRVCIRNHRNLYTTPIKMQVLLRQI